MWCYLQDPTAISPHKQAPLRTEYEGWTESTNGRTGQEKSLLPIKGTEICSLNRRLITTKTELPRLKINFAAALVSSIRQRLMKRK
jgi:hypothetical protein